MTNDLRHLRAHIQRGAWAIMPERATEIMAAIERRAFERRLNAAELDAIRGPRDLPNGILSAMDPAAGGIVPLALAGDGAATSPPGSMVGIIGIRGIIAQHASQVDDMSGPGGTSTQRVGASLDSALADPRIGGIVLDIDSPGGSVFGVQALADKIRGARGKKPIVAQVNSLGASAAYWIASAADEIVITPGGQAGSIGVVTLHEDPSALHEAMGLRYTFIYAGKNKVRGNQMGPLDPEALAAVQSVIDAYYDDFVGAVAKNRGATKAAVIDGYGQGDALKDREALRAGLVDRIGTMEETLGRMSKRRAGATGSRAMAASGLAAAAKSGLMEMRRAEDGTQTHFFAEAPPPILAFAPELLAEEFAALEGDNLMIAMANGVALYRVEGKTAGGDLIGVLAEFDATGPVPPAPLPAPTVPPAANDPAPIAEDPEGESEASSEDAYRRRRHAHRQRAR